MFVLYAVLFISHLLFTPSPNCAHMVLHSAITMTYPTNFMSHKSHETLHSSYNFSAYNEFSYPYFVLIKRRQVGPRNGAIKLCWLTLYINLQLFFFCTLYNIFFFFCHFSHDFAQGLCQSESYYYLLILHLFTIANCCFIAFFPSSPFLSCPHLTKITKYKNNLWKSKPLLFYFSSERKLSDSVELRTLVVVNSKISFKYLSYSPAKWKALLRHRIRSIPSWVTPFN